MKYIVKEVTATTFFGDYIVYCVYINGNLITEFNQKKDAEKFADDKNKEIK